MPRFTERPINNSRVFNDDIEMERDGIAYMLPIINHATMTHATLLVVPMCLSRSFVISAMMENIATSPAMV